jgi:hypothetical protein
VLRLESAAIATIGAIRVRPRPLLPRLTAEDEEAHQAFLAGLGGAPVWLRYRTPEQAIAN